MATYSGTIIQSSDDAQEAEGTVTINGGAVNANSAAGYIGFRFQNVTIPAGSTINTASLSVYLTSGSFDDPDVTIYGEDVDDAATFAATSNNISGRTLTTATGGWDAGSLGIGWETTPDFASVVQEIVDRAGWNGGQDMVYIFKGDDAATLLRISAFDSASGTYATLNIDYTEPSGGDIVPLVMHHFGQQGMN